MCILDIRKPNIRLSFLNNRISNTNILNEKKKKKKKERSHRGNAGTSSNIAEICSTEM